MQTYLKIGMVCLGLLASNVLSKELPNSIDVKLPCFNTEKVFTTLKENFGETPHIVTRTKDRDVFFSIWFNKEEKTWTMLSTIKEITCLISMGKDYTIVQELNNK